MLWAKNGHRAHMRPIERTKRLIVKTKEARRRVFEPSAESGGIRALKTRFRCACSAPANTRLLDRRRAGTDAGGMPASMTAPLAALCISWLALAARGAAAFVLAFAPWCCAYL